MCVVSKELGIIPFSLRNVCYVNDCMDLQDNTQREVVAVGVSSYAVCSAASLGIKGPEKGPG